MFLNLPPPSYFETKKFLNFLSFKSWIHLVLLIVVSLLCNIHLLIIFWGHIWIMVFPGIAHLDCGDAPAWPTGAESAKALCKGPVMTIHHPKQNSKNEKLKSVKLKWTDLNILRVHSNILHFSLQMK